MISGTGSCVVQYDQAGSANYNAAPQVTSSTTAGKAGQTITVTTPAPASAIYNSQFTVSATADSGLAVAITTSGGCSGSGSGSATITMTSGTNSCTVNFNQPGDSRYLAATPISENPAAQKADQAALTIVTLNDLSYLNSPYTLSTTGGSSTGAVTYDVGGSTVCSVVGDQLSLFFGDGTCTVTATKAGDNNYNEITDTASGVVTAGLASFIGTIQGIGFGGLSAMSFLMNHKLFDKLFRRRRKQKGGHNSPSKQA
jgi:hypothetical protein